MSRYIDADKLQESFKELHGGKRSLLIDTEPTVDVVEVVRCKDCKKREHCRTTNTWAVAPSDDWFCADGERADT